MNLKMNEMKYDVRRHKLQFPHLPHSDNFLRTFTTILQAASWFGVVSKSSRFAKLWGFCILASLSCIEGVALYRAMKAVAGYAVDTGGNRSVTARMSGAIFYGNSVFSLILLWKFKAEWPGLAAHWASAERLNKYMKRSDSSIRKILILVTIIVICGGTIEHTLSIISAVGFEFPISEFFREYALTTHGFLMFKHEYSIYLSIFLFIMSKFATILWNFQDLLIILVSFGLCSRYRQLNAQVCHMCKIKLSVSGSFKKGKPRPYWTWLKIREAYVIQRRLVLRVDKEIGGIILLSNFNNMYFICLQLFLGITEGVKRDIFSQCYYMISLLWVCMRAAGVVLAAANVNIHSRGALSYIHRCPTLQYTVEVGRLHRQLANDFVALSGRGFYYLDRTILLKVASTIATYELVLIQFDSHK